MGRSVSYPTGSTVAYMTIEQHDDGDYEHEWECLKENLVERIQKLFPSMKANESWVDQEDLALAENAHAKFGISEYCGLCAIWLYPDSNIDRDELAEGWVNRASEKFTNEFAEYNRVGGLSDGTSYYEKVA